MVTKKIGFFIAISSLEVFFVTHVLYKTKKRCIKKYFLASESDYSNLINVKIYS